MRKKIVDVMESVKCVRKVVLAHDMDPSCSTFGIAGGADRLDFDAALGLELEQTGEGPIKVDVLKDARRAWAHLDNDALSPKAMPAFGSKYSLNQ